MLTWLPAEQRWSPEGPPCGQPDAGGSLICPIGSTVASVKAAQDRLQRAPGQLSLEARARRNPAKLDLAQHSLKQLLTKILTMNEHISVAGCSGVA